MGPIPFALSVHHFINTVGSDAGFASIIGLAILVLLYFAQARETSSLREQAYEWAQRVQQLEARIAQLTRQVQNLEAARQAPATIAPAARPLVGVAVGSAAARVTGAPLRAGGVAVATAPAIGGATVGAPAGVAAPALSAATKLIPTPPPALAPQPGLDGPVPAPDLPMDLTSIDAPAPATVAGGANGHGHADPMAAEPVVAAVPPSDTAGSPPPRIQIRPGGAGSRRQIPPLRPEPSPRPSWVRRVIAGVLVVAVVGVAVAVLLIATNNSGSSTKTQSSANAGQTTNAPTTNHKKNKPKKTAVAVNPATVTVSVLNGTATNQLAHRVALKLAADGYKQGVVTTAADQTHQSTIVAYMVGHQRDAAAVATALGLKQSAVQPVDQSAQQVACPAGTASCTATTVVTVGADLSTIQ